MKVLNITVLTLTVLVISACTTSNTPTGNNEAVASKSFDYKAPPGKVPALDVPPDLTTYTSDDRYGIPGEGESGTRYSDFLQSGGIRKSSNVLPSVRNVHLERNGNQRWLVVNDKAENIWPVVKAFWLENGLSIKIENPEAGIIETDWAENRVKLPMDGLSSTTEKDQYHTRLERSKDGNSTEIYITHSGVKSVQNEGQSEKTWVPRASDPELEATMLQLLMAKLGGGSGVLFTTKKSSNNSTTAKVAAPKLNTQTDGRRTILLSEPFDKSWRKVGLALEKSGLMLADKDRSKGIYYLSAGKDDAKNKPGAEKTLRKQVNVREISSGCEIQVNNGDGTSNADTQKIVDTIFKALGRL
ncbi:MAG: outer membrane protein assembly factor BamC [Gallionellaceae bacterium]|jgi:outer membrane protein assembly factor BamC